MTGSTFEKAALVLGLLGDQMSEEILSLLDPAQADRLRTRRKASPRSNRQLREAVLDDFDRYLRFVQQQAGPQLKLHDASDGSSAETARRRGGVAATIAIDPDADPAEALEQVTEHQLAGALQSEPSRAAALLLGALPPRRTADVLAHMPLAERDLVIAEMGREQTASPEVIDRLLRTVLQRALTIPAEEVAQVDRIQRLADVLRAIDRPQRREIMQTLEEHDPDTAAAVTEKMYVFDDLETAADRTIQRVLTEIDGTTLASALSGASETIQNKIFSNLSRRARASLQEELELQTNISQAEISQSQGEVVKALARVDQEAE